MPYAHKIVNNKGIKLSDFDPNETADLTREEAEAELFKLTKELIELQEIFYAAKDVSLLIVLQGMDTSGKDGTIRSITGPLDSLSCDVSSFKVPTEEELSHDFLWRVHSQTPRRGHIKIFNRSHYEDVLVTRVHNLVPEKVWKARYQHINNFEQLLTQTGTIILKFFLYISKSEQKERLIKREQDVTKYWKLSLDDWKKREQWDDYISAYEDAINECSTDESPWYIVPANKKWFRNLAVVKTIVDTISHYKDGWLRRLQENGERELLKIKEYRN
jgi:PPK2 family polyphosphate:nucleotide phosphotransferase